MIQTSLPRVARRLVPCVGLALLLVAESAAAAPEPTYDPDPFGDADFGVGDRQPLVLGAEHDAEGRFELGAMFSSSVIDKYNSHLGLALDLTYHPLRTLGFGLYFGFLNGSTTNIVGEVFNEKLRECSANGQVGADCNLSPALPDFDQLTGSLDARVIWTPLYGKVNVVSEVDANVELYGFAGAGIHGQRTPQPLVDASQQLGWRVDNEGFGEGGLFSDAQFHGTGGVGLKIFVGDLVALRTELMTYAWLTDFTFETGNQSFMTYRYFLNTGLSLTL